jgi:ketosteroid isomerase-like protein
MSATAATRADPAQGDAPRFVERFADAWGHSDIDRLLALLTDDVVLRQPMLPTTFGKSAARDAFGRLFAAFPGLRATVHNWGAEGDVLFIEFTLTCSFGGRELSWPAVDRFLLRDGLAAERVNYFDPLPLFLKVLRRPRGLPGLLRARLFPSARS